MVHADALEFLPRLGGSRVPRPGPKPLRIDVNEATRAQERTVKGREMWALNASLRIVVLRTPTAELEWAFTPAQRDWALARLNRGSDV